jgi:hypothetical protein
VVAVKVRGQACGINAQMHVQEGRALQRTGSSRATEAAAGQQTVKAKQGFMECFTGLWHNALLVCRKDGHCKEQTAHSRPGHNRP